MSECPSRTRPSQQQWTDNTYKPNYSHEINVSDFQGDDVAKDVRNFETRLLRGIVYGCEKHFIHFRAFFFAGKLML